MIIGILALAAHVFGRSMQFQAINLSAEAGGSATSSTVHCAIARDALFAGRLTIVLATDDIRVTEIVGGDAFGNVRQSGGHSSAQAAGEHHFEASQSLATLDPTLGSDGEPVHFATIEIEILTDGPFESGIWVSGEVTLIGGETVPATLVLEGDGAGGNRFGGPLQSVAGASAALDASDLSLPNVNGGDRHP